MRPARGSSRPTGSLTMTLPEESSPGPTIGTCRIRVQRRPGELAPPCMLAHDARYSYHHAPLDLPEQVEPLVRSIEPKRGIVGRIERPVDVLPVRVVVCP